MRALVDVSISSQLQYLCRPGEQLLRLTMCHSTTSYKHRKDDCKAPLPYTVKASF